MILNEEEATKANQMVHDGDLAGVVVIPAGYTAKLLADQPVLLDVIMNQSQPRADCFRALETVTGRLLGAVEAAHISVNAIKSQNGSVAPSTLEDSLTQVISAWQEPALTVTVQKATGEGAKE